MRNVVARRIGFTASGERDEVGVQVLAARTADLWTREQPHG